MCKVLLPYLILVCLWSALLLQLRMLTEEVWETEEMTTTARFTEKLEAQKSENEGGFQVCLETDVQDDRCLKGNINTGSAFEQQFNQLHQDNETSEENFWNTAEISSERDAPSPYPKQYISLDLCLLFAYHVATKQTSAETTIFVTTALLFWKASSFPLNCTPQTSQEMERRVDFHQGDCDADWLQNGSKCYRLFHEKMNHDSARQHCNSLQSNLVKLNTAEENAFVQQMNTEYNSPGYHLWTGVQKSCPNCSETGGYNNWCPGQPQKVSSCVKMVKTGQWKEFDCEYMFAFVCEKAVTKPPYTRQQRLVAFLVPIFSCLTIAIGFTTGLLVSSVRRGNQPFKVSSRYGRTKKQRKVATWEMIETFRRASLMRRSSRPKTPNRGSIPNIEVTKVEKSENATKSPTLRNKDEQNEKEKKTPWYKSKPTNAFLAPNERRRSSGSGSNSSLYELLVRLNKMDFEQPKDSETIELHDLKQNNVEKKLEVAKRGLIVEQDRERQKSGQAKESTGQQNSFRNMAFRDSIVSVETNGSGLTTVTSVELGKDGTRQNPVALQDSEPNLVKLSTNLPTISDATTQENRDMEPNKNTQTIKVDVHGTTKCVDTTTGNDMTPTSNRNAPAGNGNSPTSHGDTPTTNCNNMHSKSEMLWTFNI